MSPSPIDPIKAAEAIQRQAADPGISAVLRASAGSGKTTVLVSRILRLLIRGAPLKSVTALTFTRKAAVEIQERLLEQVRRLTLADESERRDFLRELYGEDPGPERMARAARLFPQILEDGGGQLIGTIHTFCQILLSRFADVAGLDPAFSIIEKTDPLWDEAFRQLEAEVAIDPGAIAQMTQISKSPTGISKLLKSLLNSRLELDRWCDRLAESVGKPYRDAGMSEYLPLLSADLAAFLFSGTPLEGQGEPEIESLHPLIGPAARALAGAGLDSVLLVDESPTSALIKKIQAWRDELLCAAERIETGDDPEQTFMTICGTILTTADKVRTLPGSGACKAQRQDALEAAAAPLLELKMLQDLIALYRQNRRVLRFGLQALDIYEALKVRDRCLDFHDLERRAWRLVKDQDVGPWIRYRLDQRLDHLLVDEFQDTNLNQWEILEVFAEEFVAAQSDPPRTVFFVGDIKQSIYGFRGARPGLFLQVADWLAERDPDSTLTLPTNFRSTAAVVEGVGRAFNSEALSRRLPSPEEALSARQLHVRRAPPGRVNIIPLTVKDQDTGLGAHEQAAETCVSLIRDIVATRNLVFRDGGTRPAGYGDILILSRARTHIGEYESALREADIPFVPSGRGALARSREVRDILLLLNWLAYPADSVKLASVLRSPLFRIDDPQLRGLLAGWRESASTLWQYLGERTADEPWSGIVRMLRRWLGSSARHRTHDMLRLIYSSASALETYRAAMGEQARYNLLKLHDLALEHDNQNFPTLRGFIDRIHNADIHQDEEEATLPESGAGRVRILTIHSAKGLQAPFVILADAGKKPQVDEEKLVLGAGIDDGPLVSGIRKEHRMSASANRPTAIATAARASREKSLCEEANLLYVAMTRAEDEFHALGAEPSQKKDLPSHHQWLEEALDDEGDNQDATAAAEPPLPQTKDAAGETPDYEAWKPAGQSELLRMRFPSAERDDPSGEPGLRTHMAAEAGLESGSDEDARDRGILIHRLLQIAAESGRTPTGDDEAAREAAAVFENPEFAWIFKPAAEALCETPLLHDPIDAPGERVSGIIDRLLISVSEIVIIDYKSNRIEAAEAEACARTYRSQMAAYREAIAEIYPQRRVRTALLFTHPQGGTGRGRLVELDV